MPNQIAQKIQTALGDDNAEIKIEGFDCNLSVTIISNKFEGLNRIARHRMINAIFKEDIASGQIHALSIKALTQNEYTQ